MIPGVLAVVAEQVVQQTPISVQILTPIISGVVTIVCAFFTWDSRRRRRADEDDEVRRLARALRDRMRGDGEDDDESDAPRAHSDG